MKRLRSRARLNGVRDHRREGRRVIGRCVGYPCSMVSYADRRGSRLESVQGIVVLVT